MRIRKAGRGQGASERVTAAAADPPPSRLAEYKVFIQVVHVHWRYRVKYGSDRCFFPIGHCLRAGQCHAIE